MGQKSFPPIMATAGQKKEGKQKVGEAKGAPSCPKRRLFHKKNGRQKKLKNCGNNLKSAPQSKNSLFLANFSKSFLLANPMP